MGADQDCKSDSSSVSTTSESPLISAPIQLNAINDGAKIILSFEEMSHSSKVTLAIKESGLAFEMDADLGLVCVDDKDAKRIKLVYKRLNVDVLSDGTLSLNGSLSESFVLSYSGNAVIETGKALKLCKDSMLHGLRTLTNNGELKIEGNLATTVANFINNGKITIGGGWQDFFMQTLQNNETATIRTKRADFLSETLIIANKGIIGCVDKWNTTAILTNCDGGRVYVGNDCTLKTLLNKSQFTPVASDYATTVTYQNAANQVVNVPAHYPDTHQTASYYQIIMGYTEREVRSDRGSGFFYHGFKRKTIKQQTFTKREGRRSLFVACGNLSLTTDLSTCICSDIFVGGNLNLSARLQCNSFSVERIEVLSNWTCTSNRGWHGRLYRNYKFIDTPRRQEQYDSINATLVVVGDVKGIAEKQVNNASITTSLALRKGTLDELKAHDTDLQNFSKAHCSSVAIPFDQEKFIEELTQMRVIPTRENWIRLHSCSKSVTPKTSESVSPATVPAV
ncbi:uncharacterized protein MONOS_8772 [Monocercomonoides exilis]|uniref:uncharacterized protein n=1 Tax=Monocercomonoides exilis TaxID=2049356 RepID=UPI00355A86F4|nr:hypothetical protein MONOS_8772 [Monocercomonoides exilis]|eukprot:MONOS_8772.1-p1 / transcript=MONOS_8772.1 / gene=MONOS_8772 / organism=Monocercomonoides_exilis_PA203 / gene_product=unspecified product / transcript_product=unspecified product / location=Mono_scaffold00340:10885-12411(+) / protein_length=509 / sequence_SO=supercontig / SO=protein_coding / is_pseudo=false